MSSTSSSICSLLPKYSFWCIMCTLSFTSQGPRWSFFRSGHATLLPGAIGIPGCGVVSGGVGGPGKKTTLRAIKWCQVFLSPPPTSISSTVITLRKSVVQWICFWGTKLPFNYPAEAVCILLGLLEISSWKSRYYCRFFQTLTLLTAKCVYMCACMHMYTYRGRASGRNTEKRTS